jgi:mannose-binding lectin 2
MDAGCFLFVVIQLVLVVVVRGVRLEDLSFAAPFKEVDAAGKRVVSKAWRVSGTTVVNSNFLRLTPDRQSKRGALWSVGSLNRNAFGSILKFRISGQGTNFYGDGIAMWITSNTAWKEGEFHGAQEQFKGVAIIMDTFKNLEYAFAHRDVTILVNDGTKTYEQMTDDVVGCDIDVRYHNGRADFSVTDASRLSFFIDESSLMTVQVDARNTGNWVDCVQVQLPFERGWLEKSHIGLTASTGSLADNHDVLGLASFDDARELAEARLVRDNLPGGVGAELDQPVATDNMSDDQRISSLEDRFNAGLQRFAQFDLHLEHELAAVSEHVEHMLKQIEAKESKAEERLEEIEEVLSHTHTHTHVALAYLGFFHSPGHFAAHAHAQTQTHRNTPMHRM